MSKLALCIATVLFINVHLFGIEKDRPKVGLILAGGGAKGFAHIGVLKVLEQENIPIDYIVGTSMGSIIGAFYAVGFSPDSIEAISRRQDWQFMLSDNIKREYLSFFDKSEIDRYVVSFPLFEEEKLFFVPGGIVQGQNSIAMFTRLMRDYHNTTRFDSLPIPFACVDSDLETGDEYILDHGYLPEAVSASMAIPTIFAPLHIDGKILVDGGITNNFPVDVARSMGADILIGVDLDTGLLKGAELESIGGVISQLISFMGYDKRNENRKLLDILIKPDLSGYGTSSFYSEAVDSLVQRGYAAADSMRLRFAQVRKRLNYPDTRNSAKKRPTRQQSYFIKDIKIEGVEQSGHDYILTKFHYKTPNRLTIDEIEDGVNRVFGTRNFAKVYYRLVGDEETTLILYVKDKSISNLNAGFNYNTNDKASILLNATLSNRKADGARWSIDAVLSANPQFHSSLQFKKSFLPEIGLDILYKEFRIDVYEQGAKTITSDMKHGAGELYLFGVVKNNLMLGAGLRSEKFWGEPLFAPNLEQSNVRVSNTVYSMYGLLRFDNFDNLYFPTSGFKIESEVNIGYEDPLNAQILEAIYSAYVKAQWARSIGNKVCLLPAVYSRLIFSEKYPDIKTTLIGGTHHSPYFRESLPFIGVRRIVPVQRYSVIGRLDLRINFAKKHYLTFIGNLALHAETLDATSKVSQILGGGIAYTYDSRVGPLEVFISKSDNHKSFIGFINLGYWF